MKFLFCFPMIFSCFLVAAGLDTAHAGSSDRLPGKWTQGSYKNSFGARNYWLYLPRRQKGGPLPLMVMLHGCFQSASDFASETGMNAVAEKYGFAVLYPEQSYQDNVWKCWNWFRPENQSRNSGELSLVLGMIRTLEESRELDRRRVFVAGLSSGAAMAANLVACHSDVFSGAGLMAGLDYKAATSEGEAHQVMRTGSTHDLRESAAEAVRCSGQDAKVVALLAFHGSADLSVNPINTDRVIIQYTEMNDLLDDGQDNDSQSTRVVASRQDQVPGGYRYMTDYFGGSGAIRMARVRVEGMAHAWSGAVKAGVYADPRGPNAAEMIWQFLSNYSGLGRNDRRPGLSR